MASQPALTNNQGAILTIGGICNSERLAVVEPWGCNQDAPDKVVLCSDLVGAWENDAMSLFLASVSEDFKLLFLQAEGMTDGCVPFRVDFGPSEHPGTIAEVAEPTSVCGLLTYYEDPADVPAGKRMRTGKTFWPAVPVGQIASQSISAILQADYGAYSDTVLAGIDSVAFPGKKWFRMLATPYEVIAGKKVRTAGLPIPRVAAGVPRGYIATQRRRLLPHS